jgi:hypothetical protein
MMDSRVYNNMSVHIRHAEVRSQAAGAFLSEFPSAPGVIRRGRGDPPFRSGKSAGVTGMTNQDEKDI